MRTQTQQCPATTAPDERESGGRVRPWQHISVDHRYLSSSDLGTATFSDLNAAALRYVRYPASTIPIFDLTLDRLGNLTV